MAVGRSLVRIALRRHWRTWLALGIAAGVASGASIFLAAGAQRTGSAIDREYQATAAEDVWVGGGEALGGPVPDLARIEHLPQVMGAGKTAFITIAAGRTSEGKAIDVNGIAWAMPVDPRFGREVVRPQLLAGRLPDPAKANEAVVDAAALGAGFRLGGSVTARFLTPPEYTASATGKLDLSKGDRLKTGKGPLLTIRVVGVREMVQPDRLGSGQPTVFLTPAFTARYRRQVSIPVVVDFIRLRRGAADIEGFHRRVQRIVGSKPILFLKRSDIAGDVPRVATTQAQALLALAIVTALAALVLLGQIIARSIDTAPPDAPLRAMGLSPVARVAIASSPALAIGLVAALTAAAVAVAASPLMPIGPARNAEPHRGVDLDGAIVGSGVLGVIVVSATIGAICAARSGLRRPSPARGGDRELSVWTALRERAIARSQLPVSAEVGMRMALAPGRGPAAIPLGVGVVGLVLTLAGIVAVFGFRAGLTHLLATPALYGERYDLEGTALPQDFKALARDPSVVGVTLGAVGTADIGGRETGVIALAPRRGQSPLVMAAGHAPAAPGEVALAAQTMRAARAHIGSSIEVDAAGARHKASVVGRAVLPTLVTPKGGVEPSSGAVLTMAGMRRLGLSAQPSRTLVKLAPGVGPYKEVQRLGAADFFVRELPTDIGSLGKVKRMPLAVIVVLVVLGALALANALVLSARRRRRELAVLKALGFGPRDAGSVIAWQALTTGVVAFALGAPLGMGLGRLTWNAFARHQGMVPQAVTPWAAAAIALPAVMVAALLIAAVPALIAARIRPADELRNE